MITFRLKRRQVPASSSESSAVPAADTVAQRVLVTPWARSSASRGRQTYTRQQHPDAASLQNFDALCLREMTTCVCSMRLEGSLASGVLISFPMQSSSLMTACSCEILDRLRTEGSDHSLYDRAYHHMVPLPTEADLPEQKHIQHLPGKLFRHGRWPSARRAFEAITADASLAVTPALTHGGMWRRCLRRK